MEAEKSKVLIIGAGPSGLATLRHLKNSGVQLQCVEMHDDFGGMWNYNPDTEFSIEIEKSTHSFIRENHTVFNSMYEFLDTNVPIPVMQFKDFCKRKEGTFFSRPEFREYLSQYVAEFDLL